MLTLHISGKICFIIILLFWNSFVYQDVFWLDLKDTIAYHIIRNSLTSPVYIFLPRIAEDCVVNSGLLKQIILATLTTQFLIYNMQLCI